ncbi:MAG: pirin family protein [Bacteroidia bacterium]|nr:pirin family protein [Bacteroidia bacterium]MDW8333394.1 pirin family protein [Bacteroidia bacterium]
MKDAIFYPADTRGSADFGWLKARYSFSFGSYFDPERVNFGALRVLNDDLVAPGRGFAPHPHDNMEIITIPLFGALEHRDSTGMRDVIQSGDVQIMSAGSGIWHSEVNAGADQPLGLLQIWILPQKRDIPPRYNRKSFPPEGRKNRFQTVVSSTDPNALPINQNAHLSQADLTDSVAYSLFDSTNGVYIFVIEGSVETEGFTLKRRDALGLRNRNRIVFHPIDSAKILVVEIPV